MNKKHIYIFFTVALFLIALPLSLIVGPADTNLKNLVNIFWGTENSTLSYIVIHMRIPRVVLAFIVGASLSVSGAVFQGLLINPLADSYTTGVSSGAAFGAAVAIVTGLGSVFIPLFSLVGSLSVFFVVLKLAKKGGGLTPRNIILAGVVISAIVSSAISFLKTIAGDSLASLVFWLMGSFSGADYKSVVSILVYFVIGNIIILMNMEKLNLMSLGKEEAYSTGINTELTQKLLITSASILAASAVSVSGIIGFVGLIVPHSVRIMFGADHKLVIPISFIMGGTVLVWADIAVRMLYPFGEVPVGVFTSLIGGPFFCWLLVRGSE